MCGGRGICGRCQVTPAFGSFAKHGIEANAANLSDVSDSERRYASKRPLAADRRLSCSTKILGDMVIDVPSDGAMNRQMVRKKAEVRDIARDPATRLYYVEVEPPDMDEPRGDLDRVLAGRDLEAVFERLRGLAVDQQDLGRIVLADRRRQTRRWSEDETHLPSAELEREDL